MKIEVEEGVFYAEPAPPLDVTQEVTGFKPLDDFRALVRREVTAAIARHHYHKRFEGQISYSVDLAPVTDWREMPDPLGRQPDMHPQHVLKLYSYIIGPSRLYEWTGKTAREVFAKATSDFLSWVAEDLAEEP